MIDRPPAGHAAGGCERRDDLVSYVLDAGRGVLSRLASKDITIAYIAASSELGDLDGVAEREAWRTGRTG